MPDDDDGRGGFRFVGGQQVATQCRRRIGDGKRRGCDFGYQHRFGGRLRGHEVVLRIAKRAEVLHRGQLTPKSRELVENPPLRAAGVRPDELEGDDPFAPGKRQRGIEQLGEDLEQRGASRNRDRHRKRTNHRQPAMLDQHPHAKSGIQQDRVQPAKAADVASRFLVFLDAAKADQGPSARLPRRQPLVPHQALGLHLDVEPHFVVHLGCDLVAAGEDPPIRSDPRCQAPHEVRHLPSLLLTCQGETNARTPMFPGGWAGHWKRVRTTDRVVCGS